MYLCVYRYSSRAGCCCLSLEVNYVLSLQVTASPRRAAQKCEPTSTTCISSTISRLCLNCHTGWSLVLRVQLSLLSLCQPYCWIAKKQSIAVSSISQDPLSNQRTVRDPGRPQEGAAQSGNSHHGWEYAEKGQMHKYLFRSTTVSLILLLNGGKKKTWILLLLLNTWQQLAGAELF